jgi:hypothetical protein
MADISMKGAAFIWLSSSTEAVAAHHMLQNTSVNIHFPLLIMR